MLFDLISFNLHFLIYALCTLEFVWIISFTISILENLDLLNFKCWNEDCCKTTTFGVTTKVVIEGFMSVKCKINFNCRLNRFLQSFCSEIMEGFIPILYATCMVMAYYGPNASMLTNIGSTYWGEKIEDVGPVLISMVILFMFDIISVVVTSVLLWKVANLNMLQEFRKCLDKYWLFLIVKLGLHLTAYFGGTEIS